LTITAAGLAAAITAEQGPAQDTDIQDAENLKLATAIINYLVANTVVSVNVSTTGTAAAQTGSGTGTIS